MPVSDSIALVAEVPLFAGSGVVRNLGFVVLTGWIWARKARQQKKGQKVTEGRTDGWTPVRRAKAKVDNYNIVA